MLSRTPAGLLLLGLAIMRLTCTSVHGLSEPTMKMDSLEEDMGVPFIGRNKTDVIHEDLTCLRVNKGAVFYMHFRKAGGTTFNKLFLSAYCNKEGVEYVHDEYEYFDRQYFFDNPGITFVTVLRDPIQRILSSWAFEGVCDQFDNPCVRPKRIFSQWISQNQATEQDRRQGGFNFLAIEIDNYYVRRLTSLVDPAGPLRTKATRRTRLRNGPLGPADLEAAKRVLENFHAVLILEDLQQPSVHAAVAGTLGIKIPRQSQRETSSRRKQVAKESADSASVERLRLLNKWDLELFEYARKLFQRQMAQWATWQLREGEKSESTASGCEERAAAVRASMRQAYGEPNEPCFKKGKRALGPEKHYAHMFRETWQAWQAWKGISPKNKKSTKKKPKTEE
uniref:Sulfotransferase domain-containing protein n=1 Tax=Heterosigma akashiwo TaxID=2829 RepID=A0A7S4D6F4_HETAK